MTKRLKAWGDTKIISIACCLIFNEANKVLLLQRHSEDLGGGQWGTPGGRTEKDETADMAVVREVKEETGLQLDETTFLGVHEIEMPHGTVHMSSYRADVSGADEIAINPSEHQAYGWFDIDTLITQPNILWGVPTVLHDFGFLNDLKIDPTLNDGTKVKLLS